MRVEVLSCILDEKGSAPRFYLKLLLPFGMILHGVTVTFVDGRRRVLVSKRPLLKNGEQLRGDSGDLLFAPTLTFDSRAAGDAFTAAVLDAARASHPEALAALRAPPLPAQAAGAAA